MKNRYIIILFSILFISCESSDVEVQVPENKNRIKQITTKVGNDETILRFVYNGDSYQCYSAKNKSNEDIITLAYHNGLIKTSGRIFENAEYFYENNNVSEIHIGSPEVNEIYKFFYNTDNQLEKSEHYNSSYFNLSTLFEYTIFEYDENGNNSRTNFYKADSTLFRYEINTFDNKNNIFKYFDPKIVIRDLNPYGNNLIKKIQYYYENTPTTFNYEYIYNENNFPTKATVTSSENETVYYEYIYD